MKVIRISLFFFLLPTVISVEHSYHQSSTIKYQERESPLRALNPQVDEDSTKNLVKIIFDMYQIFNTARIQKDYTEWISKNLPLERPSKIINNKTITFIKIAPVKEERLMKDLFSITCEFKPSLVVHISGGGEYSFAAEGEISLRSENLSSCKVSFNARFSNIDVDDVLHYDFKGFNFIIMPISQDIFNKSNKIVSDFELKIINFEVKGLKSMTCQQDADENQLREETLQAMKMIMKETLEDGVQSIFQAQYSTCFYPQFDEKKGTRSHFKLDLNMAGFPWESEYHELIITGLNVFRKLQVFYAFSETRFYLYVNPIIILWIIRSLDTKQFNFITNSVQIKAEIGHGIDYTDINLSEMSDANHIPDKLGMKIYLLSNDISLKIPTMFEDHNGNEIEVKKELREKIASLMQMGIENTFQKVRYDGTAELTTTISQILHSFNGNVFKNLFDDLENQKSKSSYISFSKIEFEVYSHLENITCMSDSYNQIQKIGIIRYKDIKGEGDYIDYIKSENDYIAVRGSMFVHLKEVNFNISLQKYQYQHSKHNRTNEIVVKIEGNFMTNTTISLYNTLHRQNSFRRKYRILVGQRISTDFINLFKDRVEKNVKSVFHPLIEICTSRDSLSSFDKPNSDYFSDWREYFAFIRGHWVNSRDPTVDVVIKGIWSIKNINARYVNENIIIDGLRIENITGSMKLRDKPPEESIILNYTASSLLLTINHSNTNVTVKVPGSLKLTNTSNRLINNAFQIEVTKIFEMTVASFIQQSIYNSTIRYTKYRKLINEAMKEEERKETLSTNDTTSIFVNNFAEILKNVKVDEFFKESSGSEIRHWRRFEDNLTADDYKTSNHSFHYDAVAIDFQHPIITEEICGDFDYSQSVQRIVGRCNVHGNLSILLTQNSYGKEVEHGRISFSIRKPCIMNSANKNKYSDEDFKVNINITMKIGERDVTFYENLRTKITKTANDFLQEYNYDYYRLPTSPDICGRRYGSLKSLKNNFYLITDIIDDASQYYLIHYKIKIYGLHNFKFLRLTLEANEIGTTFELNATNLTAHIMWGYYMENSPPKILEKLDLQIAQIILIGIINNSEDYQLLHFNNRSRLEFSDPENLISLKLKETLQPIIINSIKKSVKEKYLEG